MRGAPAAAGSAASNVREEERERMRAWMAVGLERGDKYELMTVSETYS